MSEGKTNRIGLIVAGIVVVLIAVVVAATRHREAEAPAVAPSAATESPAAPAAVSEAAKPAETAPATEAAVPAANTEAAANPSESTPSDAVVAPAGEQPTAPAEKVADAPASSSDAKAAAKSESAAKGRMENDKGMGASAANTSDENFDPEHPYAVKDGKVTKFTYQGYMRYGMFCFHCHGPDGLGSSYAPNLTQSLTRMSYEDFVQTVMNGRNAVSNSTFNVMPSFGTDPNVANYIDNIYSYLKGRSDNAIPQGRPSYVGQKVLK